MMMTMLMSLTRAHAYTYTDMHTDMHTRTGELAENVEASVRYHLTREAITSQGRRTMTTMIEQAVSKDLGIDMSEGTNADVLMEVVCTVLMDRRAAQTGKADLAPSARPRLMPEV